LLIELQKMNAPKFVAQKVDICPQNSLIPLEARHKLGERSKPVAAFRSRRLGQVCDWGLSLADSDKNKGGTKNA
jgi:hypothetical protein